MMRDAYEVVARVGSLDLREFPGMDILELDSDSGSQRDIADSIIYAIQAYLVGKAGGDTQGCAPYGKLELLLDRGIVRVEEIEKALSRLGR